MSPAYFDLFHRRMQKASGEIPDTYFYTLTESFRKRFIILLSKSVEERTFFDEDIDEVVEQLRIAFGVLSLDELSHVDTRCNSFHEIKFFILKCDNINQVISAIELICRRFLLKSHFDTSCITFIDAVNEFFKYDRIGYIFVCKRGGFIIPIEDDIFFCECTEKSLSLLSLEGYSDVQTFFIDAYKKLAASDYDDALVNICRAIETLLKIRFARVGITYDDKDTLKKLLDIAKKHITTPYSFEYFQQTILEIGRVRNKMGAHGVTPGVSPVADELHVRFAINQAAANLLFLTEVPMAINKGGSQNE